MENGKRKYALPLSLYELAFLGYTSLLHTGNAAQNHNPLAGSADWGLRLKWTHASAVCRDQVAAHPRPVPVYKDVPESEKFPPHFLVLRYGQDT